MPHPERVEVKDIRAPAVHEPRKGSEISRPGDLKQCDARRGSSPGVRRSRKWLELTVTGTGNGPEKKDPHLNTGLGQSTDKSADRSAKAAMDQRRKFGRKMQDAHRVIPYC